MLTIKNLKTKAEGKDVLNGIDLAVGEGELVVIFGPNGCGKTTLLKSIVGLNADSVVSGEIKFKGKKINKLTIDERSRMGIALMYQKPPKVDGLKLSELAKILSSEEIMGKNSENLNVSKFLDRGVNSNLSGGETKRSELFQLALMESDLYLLDEPDSGVDLVNIKLIAGEIEKLLKKGKSAIVVTHNGEMLKYLKADRGLVMIEGKIQCEGRVDMIFETINKVGYGACVKCLCRGERKWRDN